MALNQSQYNAILRMYDQRQLHTRRILEERRNEILAKLPRIKEIEDSISSLSVKQARKLLDGAEGALSALKNRKVSSFATYRFAKAMPISRRLPLWLQ